MDIKGRIRIWGVFTNVSTMFSTCVRTYIVVISTGGGRPLLCLQVVEVLPTYVASHRDVTFCRARQK